MRRQPHPRSLAGPPSLRRHSLALALAASAVLAAGHADAAFKVVGYFPTWQGDVNSIPYNKVTHINYSFLLPTANGGLQALDGGTGRLQTLVSKAHSAGVKVLIAVGGWNDGNDSAFVSLSANSGSRSTFVNNLVNFVNQNGLDGVDIDWEYPDAGSEANNFRALMQELGSALHACGKLLTAAVTANDFPGSVDSAVINAVDYLNLMVYDLGTPHSSYSAAQNALTTWKFNEGLPKDKAVLGVPFYSHTNWVAYKDIIARYGASAAQVDNAGGLDYNGQPTIHAKAQLARNEGGGIMFWEISQDTRDGTSLMTEIWNVVGSAAGGGSSGGGSGGGSTGGGSSGGGTTGYPTWQQGTNYKTGDIVSFNGKLYIAEHDNPGYDPTISTWFWDPYTPPSGGGNSGGTSSGQGPYNSSPIAIPGTLEAEHYDKGRFYDTTAGNSGGQLRSDNVDIEKASQNGYNIGWIESGEWLEYSVNVSSAGSYKVEALVASQSSGGSFSLSQDGSKLASLNVPVSGGWQNWTWVSTTVNLAAGQHILRISMDKAGFNLNALKFSQTSSSGGSTGGGSTSGGSSGGSCTVTAWSEGKTYTAGTLVSYNGSTYKALVTHTAYVGAGWNPSVPSLWQKVSSGC